MTQPFLVALEVIKNGCDLRDIIRRTWRYFDAATDPTTHLVDDHVKSDGSRPARTTPTNVAMSLFAHSYAHALGLEDDAEARCAEILETLERLERCRGFFLNWYDTGTGEKLTTWERKHPLDLFLSSIDNAWLATALLHVLKVFPNLRTNLVREMDFRLFYDPEKRLFLGGIFPVTGLPSRYHYGLFHSETRLLGYLAEYLGQGDPEHWDALQRPIRDDVPLSCHGSLFEALAVPLFVPEDISAYGGYVQRHIAYSQEGFWGASFSDDTDGYYREFGLHDLAVFPIQQGGVVSPYASFLTLKVRPADSLRNISRLGQHCLSELGFRGAFRPKDSAVSDKILTLEQGCIFVAGAQFLGVDLDYAPFGKDFRRTLLGHA